MDKNQEIECLSYFRKNPIWGRLLEGFRKKYLSYGKFSGTVTLKKLSRQDIEELEGFFGKNFHGQKSVSISAINFRSALQNSRYSEITPEKLLELFFEETMIGKREQRLLLEQQKREILNRMSKEYAETPAMLQFPELQQIAGSGDLAMWEQRLHLILQIFNHLPYRENKQMYLAVFAAQLTGNPHAFDRDTEGGTLLYKVVQLDLNHRKITLPNSEVFPMQRQQRQYLEVGILLDDISNCAMLYNVQAIKKNGTIHQGVEGFSKENDSMQVALSTIAEWKELHCVNRKMYIVENPSVFALLCSGRRADNLSEEISCMCMNGQPRLSAIMVLDLLAKTGIEVYYAGDFDPEGLLIAQKLSQYYKGKFHYWRMTVEDYEQCKSQEIISDKRLKMLERITEPQLCKIALALQKTKKAGYQEKLFV